MNERLKELRFEHNLTQKQIAEHLGISIRAYSHYEMGDREPSVEIIKQLCRLFDVSADYLLGLTD